MSTASTARLVSQIVQRASEAIYDVRGTTLTAAEILALGNAVRAGLAAALIELKTGVLPPLPPTQQPRQKQHPTCYGLRPVTPSGTTGKVRP